MRAKASAKRRNLPFTIEKSDIVIPTLCPVLSRVLNRFVGTPETKDSAPSIDRCYPELGYTKENITIMSWRANMLKRDATLQELEQLVKFLRKKIKQIKINIKK